jgi:hypothetical protein
MTQREAAERMGVSERWVRKLLRRMKRQGDAMVVHGLRGQASNRKLPAKTQKQAMLILREPDWHDFGPTFAAEQLAKLHQLQVGKETLRGWMIEAGMWQPGSRKILEVHGWRPRRSGFGELVQWDTSDHDWLEGRGPVRYLVRLIDDATSWSWGRFVERDATPFNMAVLWEYIEKNGRMVDVYTDRQCDVRGATARPVARLEALDRMLPPSHFETCLYFISQRIHGAPVTDLCAGLIQVVDNILELRVGDAL